MYIDNPYFQTSKLKSIEIMKQICISYHFSIKALESFNGQRDNRKLHKLPLHSLNAESTGRGIAGAPGRGSRRRNTTEVAEGGPPGRRRRAKPPVLARAPTYPPHTGAARLSPDSPPSTAGTRTLIRVT